MNFIGGLGCSVFPQELANALQSAHPKIQKMCEEESDDHEAVAKLFEINDSIYRTIERYRLIKKGDVEGAAKIPRGTLGTSGAGVSKGPDNELSLIDFGGPDESSATDGMATSASAIQPKGNALEDDLLGLSVGDNAYGQGGGISLGLGNGSSELPWAFVCATLIQTASLSIRVYTTSPRHAVNLKSHVFVTVSIPSVRDKAEL